MTATDGPNAYELLDDASVFEGKLRFPPRQTLGHRVVFDAFSREVTRGTGTDPEVVANPRLAPCIEMAA